MELSKKQSEFLEAVKNGENVFLTGKAGTGKSFVVKEAMRILRENGNKVAAIAPTGIAANNIGGATIHSTFQLGIYGVLNFEGCAYLRTEKKKMIRSISTIIIDEVSMLRPDVLDGINWTLLKNGCGGLEKKQIIFVGDMKQLPVVLDDNMRSMLFMDYDGEDFTFAKVFPKLNINTIELDEVLRQSDEDFITNLNIIREGKKSEYFKKFVSTDTHGVILAPHNATVEKYNQLGLESIKDHELIEFHASVTGNVKAADFNVESTISVKYGAKIMYLVNSKENSLVNGTIGQFITFAGCYYIRVNDVDYALNKVQFIKKEYVLNEKENRLELKEIGSIEQYPIRLAYALSIHKSQGLTFDEITVDLTRPCFAKGQMYVALSRVTSPNGLKILI